MAQPKLQPYEMNEEEKDVIRIGNSFLEMVRTEGWTLFREAIEKLIKATEDYIINDMPAEDSITRLPEQRGRVIAFKEVLNEVDSHIKGADEIKEKLKGGNDDA